jgi:RND family efflux transporter MFP subunit
VEELLMNLRPVCLLLTSCLLFRPGAPSAGQEQRAAVEPPPVEVTRPVVREVRDDAAFTGRTEAAQTVDVRPRVTGYLVKVAVKPGTTVKEGDLLFEIDPRPYEPEVRKAEAMLRVRELRLKRAAAEREQADRLRKNNVITQEEVDRLQTNREIAAAELASARANLDLARLNLEFTRVRAPMNGRLGRLAIDAGNLVRADDTTLATIVSLDPMYVYFDVSERTVLLRARLTGEGKTESEATVRLDLANGDRYPHRGIIDFVDNRVNPSTGTLRIRAIVPNAGWLLVPGLSVRVLVTMGAPHKALLVPDQAVLSDQGRKYVYVVTEKNVVQRRSVNLGPLQDGLREVTEGLTAEDWVVVRGQQKVKPDVAVKPRRVPAPREKPSPDK